jgi:hypothetical protein
MTYVSVYKTKSIVISIKVIFRTLIDNIDKNDTPELVDYSLYSEVNDVQIIKGSFSINDKNKNKNKKQNTNAKRKLTRTQNEIKKMETAYENDEVSDAADFLRKFSKSK